MEQGRLFTSDLDQSCLYTDTRSSIEVINQMLIFKRHSMRLPSGVDSKDPAGEGPQSKQIIEVNYSCESFSKLHAPWQAFFLRWSRWRTSIEFNYMYWKAIKTLNLFPCSVPPGWLFISSDYTQVKNLNRGQPPDVVAPTSFNPYVTRLYSSNTDQT